MHYSLYSISPFVLVTGDEWLFGLLEPLHDNEDYGWKCFSLPTLRMPLNDAGNHAPGGPPAHDTKTLRQLLDMLIIWVSTKARQETN